MTPDRDGLKKKIKGLIAFRAIFVTLFFGLSFFFRVFERFEVENLIYYLIGSLYVLTLMYSLVFSRVRNLVAFAYVQLFLDVICEITLIRLTGGVESPFSFTLVATIIASSVVLDKKAGFILATVSSLLYGILVNLQLYQLVQIQDDPLPGKDYLYKLFVHIIFFYLTAYLSGYLSSRLERTVRKLEEKDHDFRDLEYFNREVIEEMPSGMFTTDTDGKVFLFNRSAERITGVKRDLIAGRRIDSVLPFFPFPFSEGRDEDTITIDGVKKIIGLTITPLKSASDETKGYIAVFQDLTQIKKLETEIRQKEKWATIGELSSNIAHEIRNPLASLKSSIEMLRENSVPENYKGRLMEIALSEMDRLNCIITDFLTYSRPSSPELKRCDIHLLLTDTIELLRNVTKGEGHVDIEKNFGGIAEVEIDPQKMRQVFLNLGINAIEAMPGGGRLAISTSNGNGFFSVVFRDTGGGIAEKDIGKIFYPFFTTKERGTGLGLAIAYRIVDEHGGMLRVKSTSRSGTIFEVLIPVEK